MSDLFEKDPIVLMLENGALRRQLKQYKKSTLRICHITVVLMMAIPVSAYFEILHPAVFSSLFGVYVLADENWNRLFEKLRGYFRNK